MYQLMVEKNENNKDSQKGQVTPKNVYKLHDELVQCFPKSSPKTTGGPLDQLKWSANPYTNQNCVLKLI